MLQVILARGLPGSGKSTWARSFVKKNPQFKRVSKDDLRAMIDGEWGKKKESFIIAARDALIMAALREGFSVVCDDTNLDLKHQQHIEAFVKATYGTTVRVNIQDFTDVPLEECIKRDQQRANYVGEKVIRRMYRQYLQPKVETPEYDPTLPDGIICDLDGTLALLNGRNPYDASTCEQDLVNEPVLDLLRRYYHSSFGKIHYVMVSGRMEKHRSQTENWLRANGIMCDALFMRPTDDNRKDAIIKQEIYEREIKGKYNVRFVLDDRSSVVDFWRSQGLTCFQVNYGDF